MNGSDNSDNITHGIPEWHVFIGSPTGFTRIGQIKRKIHCRHRLPFQSIPEAFRDSGLRKERKQFLSLFADNIGCRYAGYAFHERIPDPIVQILVVNDYPFLNIINNLKVELIGFRQLLLSILYFRNISGMGEV